MSNFTLMASNFMEIVEMFELHRQSAFRAALAAVDAQAKRADFYCHQLKRIEEEAAPGANCNPVYLAYEALAEGELRFPERWDEKIAEGLIKDFDMARQCRVCGCSSLTSCTAEGKPMCTWVELDLCSNCQSGEKIDPQTEGPAKWQTWEEPGMTKIRLEDGTQVTHDFKEHTTTVVDPDGTEHVEPMNDDVDQE